MEQIIKSLKFLDWCCDDNINIFL